ncbi:S53 family peptidase [Stygiolobus caldivivus]|uniref:Peptidase S53 domain-containing protein n=1 Tax=Stygiolobus caldivivus TaxID=2824673 RepID=A0A8D5U4T6_9CREN|nr:protease pro-enzyme activation domain-containing protein [Stygiolobus caldivivus]BCU69289.1 hypothetical protein KN1_05860 [Stygiolobus caldivivus]
MWSALAILLLLLTGVGVAVLPLSPQSVTTSSPQGMVNVTIVIPPKNVELLQMYVQQHVVLNQSQVVKTFIPTQKISDLVQQLRSHGINATVNLNVISFSAPAPVVEKLFHGEFVTFTFEGKKVYEFLSRDTSIPGVIIATNLTEALFSKPSTLYNITQAVAYSCVTPSEIQQAYNITYLFKHGINGSGTNIGILDFEGDPYIYQQLEKFDQEYNISAPPMFKVVPIGAYNPNDGIESGWALEISLDVEYAHAAAPGAGIVLYVANPSVSLPQAIAYIDQQDEVNVVSQSFGIPEIDFLLGLLPLSYLQSMIYEYWIGEVEGITFLGASGDAGGNGYNFYLSPLGSQIVPAAIPYILAVGGSSLYVSGNESVQTAWSGESVIGSTTGGFSSIFPAPPYQGMKGFRQVPDVVAVGNPYTGVNIVYYHGESILVGGTSLATPTVAGIIDLATEVHGKLGFVNNLIYSLNCTPALVPITFGYNSPYVANSTYNPVTGLGYINAGYLVELLKVPKATLSLAVQNTTYLPGQQVQVIAKLNGVNNKPMSLTAVIYNGTDILGQTQLVYNGSYYVGSFTAPQSGVYEVVTRYNNLEGFTYFIDGYQAIFIFPVLAIYPIPTAIPILVMVDYPNGTLVPSFNNTQLEVYSENQLNGKLTVIGSTTLTSVPIINITALGISIKYKTGILEGYINYTSVKDLGGVLVLKVANTLGLDEIVLGSYVVPIIIPNSFAEPTVIYPGENITAEVAVESLGMPNVSVSFIKGGKVFWNFTVNSITYNGLAYYIRQVTVPMNLTPGYYDVKAYGIYSNGTYVTFGEGYTQVYVASSSLSYRAHISSIAFENQTVTVKVGIYYPNGTPVKFGTFSAIIVPRYLVSQLDDLEISNTVPLTYNHGVWLGNFTLPSGNSPNSGISSSDASGVWDVYIVGSSYNGYAIPFNSTLNYESLTISPLYDGLTFVVLPYTYVENFSGSLAYGLYIENAVFKNENVTLVNSIVENLTAVNSSILLINTQVHHLDLINSEILKNISTATESNINVVTSSSSSTPNYSSNHSTSALHGNFFTAEVVIAILISFAPLIYFSLRKK